MVDDAYIQGLKEAGWPQEFHKKLRVGDLRSTVGIATLWTPQDIVAGVLSPDSYAILGNYYDRRNAFEPFARNCLANPNIRHVILVGNDKSGSREVLVNFFAKGIEDGFVAGTDCRVPAGIPLEDLEDLRANVTLHDIVDRVSDLSDPAQYAAAINAVLATIVDDKPPYAVPRAYEKPVIVADSFPSEQSGIVVRGQYVGEVWVKALRAVYDYGRTDRLGASDTSAKMRTVNNLVCVVSDENPNAPRMEEYFRFDENYLRSYYDEICTPKIPEGVEYTYGSRLRAWKGKGGEVIDQVADMITVLREKPYRAVAFAQTWIVEGELTRKGTGKNEGSPCLISVQPFVVDGKVSLTAYIRTNDIFRAWPLNAFGLRKLQKIIADGAGLPMGVFTTVSCSAHIYGDNWQDTKEIIEKYGQKTNCFFDARGYYAISLKEGKIHAEHFSPDSQFLKAYDATTAREIDDAINSSQHPVDSYHSSYLGEELMKAEVALRLGIEYVQDSPLDLGAKSDGDDAGIR